MTNGLFNKLIVTNEEITSDILEFFVIWLLSKLQVNGFLCELLYRIQSGALFPVYKLLLGSDVFILRGLAHISLKFVVFHPIVVLAVVQIVQHHICKGL